MAHALVTNNATATLASSINSVSTTINLTAGQGALFPSPSAGNYFYATLVDSSNNLEIVQCTARSTDALTVTRGAEGTSARSYGAGDRLVLRPTAALFNEKAPLDSPTFTGTVTAAQVTLTGTLTAQGDVVLGDNSADNITIAPAAVTWSGNPTHSGNHTFSGNLTATGNTTLGNASGDTLTIVPNAVTWSNNPTHSGNHTFSGNVTVSGSTAIAGLTATAAVFIGDTANANSTLGVTVNQGAADDEIISFKSSDVSHVVTSETEADTFCAIKKQTASQGGVEISAYRSAGSSVMMLRAFAATDDTSKDNNSVAPIIVSSRKQSGTAGTTVGANGNIFVIRNEAVTRQIFDAEGDSHQDVGSSWTNFDAHNDVALLNATSALLSPDTLRVTFAEGFLMENRARLEELRIVTFNDDGHHFINWSRFHMLHMGATRYLADQLAALNTKVDRGLMGRVSRGCQRLKGWITSKLTDI